MKYSHNAYWCKNPVQDTVKAGLDAIEFDLVYRMLDRTIYCSHSWKPFNFMYYGKLLDYLIEIAGSYEINYLILEPKTFTMPYNIIAELLAWFKLRCYENGNNVAIVMSVQYRKHPHQWLRGLWLKKFFRLYKDELGILDKRKETALHEQVDLYEKKWWMF